MPKLPAISQKDAVRVLSKIGFRMVRESGHVVMSDGQTRLTIPRHPPLTRSRWERLRRTPASLPRNSATSSDFFFPSQFQLFSIPAFQLLP